MRTPPADRKRSAVPRWIIASSWLMYSQVRQGWRILLFIGLVTLLANVFVCSIPLFSAEALDSSLQSTFNPLSHPSSRVLRVGADAGVLSLLQIAGVEKTVNTLMRRDFGALALAQPTVSVESWTYDVYPTRPNVASNVDPAQAKIFSAPDAVIRQHLDLIAGRFPEQDGIHHLQLVVLASTAKTWHVGVGSTVFVEVARGGSSPTTASSLLPATIVGVATIQPDDPVFGSDVSSLPTLTSGAQVYPVFGSLDATLALGQEVRAPTGTAVAVYSYYLTYLMAADRLHLGQIEPVIGEGSRLSFQLLNANLATYHLAAEYVDQDDFLTTLSVFQSHVLLFQAPVLVLIAELVTFTVIFTAILGEFSVASRIEAITTLRSRGIDRGEILCSSVIQALAIGLPALVLSPLLAAVLVKVIGGGTFLPGATSPALDRILLMAWSVAWYASIGVGSIMLAMVFAAMGAASLNMLTARREVAREARRPYWQRLYLDVVLLIIGGVGYISYHQIGQSLGSYVLHANQYLLLFSVLSPLLIAAAVALLFLRLYPAGLRLCSILAGMNRGAVPMIAIAKVARAPRHATTVTLLIGLAVGISLLTTVTLVTQQQRAYDIATLTVGTDFQGVVPDAATESVQSLTKRYATLPGVMAVSVGTSVIAPYTVGESDVMVEVLAMDADTFGRTAYWNSTFGQTPLSVLMQQLREQRSHATAADVVPAIVDASTWSALGLSVGDQFSLALPGYSSSEMKFVAVNRVQYLPSIVPTPGPAVQDGAVQGGILVDYQTLKAVYSHDVPGSSVEPTSVWIRATPGPGVLVEVRSRLSAGSVELSQLQDRSALIEEYQRDPVQRALLFAQVLVAFSVVVLVFLSVFYSTWSAAIQRTVDFAFLRALGASKGELRGVMIWEQILTIIAGFLLGVIAGSILMQVLVPALAFTQLVSDASESSVVAFDIPPVHLIIPIDILGAVLGTMLVLWLLGGAYMANRVARIATSQALRLNQD